MSRHPGTQHLLDLLGAYQHLPPKLQAIASRVSVLAEDLVADLEDGPELTVALRHLLDGKDAFVRQQVIDLKKAGTPAPPNDPEPELR